MIDAGEFQPQDLILDHWQIAAVDIGTLGGILQLCRVRRLAQGVRQIAGKVQAAAHQAPMLGRDAQGVAVFVQMVAPEITRCHQRRFIG